MLLGFDRRTMSVPAIETAGGKIGFIDDPDRTRAGLYTRDISRRESE